MFPLGILGAVLSALVAWTPPLTYETEHFRFRYVRDAGGDAVSLARKAEAIRQRIVGDLGRAPSQPTTVIVVARRAEFQRAQPGGRRFPGWVAGVAYPRKNLIILGPAPPGGRPLAREVLFAHEYSHVALSHAVDHRRLPIWFVEGFADLQAMAPHLGDWRAWGGAGALPLARLHKDLGHDGQRASLSYRQSYDFVRFLRGQGDGLTFRRFIRRLAAGEEFNRALKQTYRVSTGELERKWRKQWNWRNVLVPMITSGLFLWVLSAFLLVLGYIRKRRERRAAIAAMDGEEEAYDEVLRAVGDDGEIELLGAPGAEIHREPDGPPPREEHPILNMGVLLMATLLVITLTAIFASIWPRTRLWMLAAPAVLITIIGLRWASR